MSSEEESFLDYEYEDMMEDMFKVKEAANFLKVSTMTLQRWDRLGKFKALRNPINNYRQYKRKDLERLAKKIAHRS